MYVAKEAHTGICRYDPDQDVYDATNLSLVTQLRHSIDAGQLELFYQPKAVLTDGNIDAVEALVRWHHPVEGLVLPGRFIPLVEQTDVIDRLTEWVLVTALQDVTERFAGLSVAVNVSARSLGRNDFTDQVLSGDPAGGCVTGSTHSGDHRNRAARRSPAGGRRRCRAGRGRRARQPRRLRAGPDIARLSVGPADP